MNTLTYIIILLCIIALAIAVFLYTRHPKAKNPTPCVEVPQETADVPDHENDEKAVTQNKQLIENLHKVLEEDMVFLQPDIRIDDVAKMICSNRTYVTRLMRQEYGLSFIEYVNVARIQYSQKLLYTSNKTLDEIAEMSGFQSTSNYCRAFKRYIGTSPVAWLESVK